MSVPCSEAAPTEVGRHVGPWNQINMLVRRQHADAGLIADCDLVVKGDRVVGFERVFGRRGRGVRGLGEGREGLGGQPNGVGVLVGTVPGASHGRGRRNIVPILVHEQALVLGDAGGPRSDDEWWRV